MHIITVDVHVDVLIIHVVVYSLEYAVSHYWMKNIKIQKCMYIVYVCHIVINQYFLHAYP